MQVSFSFAAAWAASALLALGRAHAAEPVPVQDPQHVDVSAHEPAMEEKSYRDLLAAMRRFESYRAAHPDARLRFHIYQRQPGVDLGQLRVWILDPEDRSHVDVALSADGSFTVPVLEKQRADGARVRTNMPDGTLTWLVEIKRGDDDDRHHLLGDLREACLLDVDDAHLGRAIKLPAFYVLDAVAGNICTVRGTGWGQAAARPVFAVHLSAGARHAALLADQIHGPKHSPFCPISDACGLMRDRLYSAPLNDSSWPDDTSVDVVYTDDPDEPSAVPAATTPAVP